MGIEILEQRVFNGSIARSTRFLKEISYDWDPVTELSKKQKKSRLNVFKISQPIYLILQITLVNELRLWGVTPSKIVSYFSGEIEAAYTTDILSHRDALVAAYFRGTASARLIKKKRTGGMMAVGYSQNEVQKLIKKTRLQAMVTYVNSLSNVTISSDIITLEALRALLDKRGVFAR